ncbi:peptidoglycan-binding domain-containing protein [Streptomyces sp. NPDC002536]
MQRIDLSLPGPASHRRGRRRWIPYAAGGATLLAALGVTALTTVGGGPSTAVSLPDAGGAADGLGHSANNTERSGSSSAAAVPGHSDAAAATHRTATSSSPSVTPAREPARSATSASQTPSSASTSAPAGDTLRRGDSGAAVHDLQYTLWRLGFYHGHQYGSYDVDTADSVRKFQEWDGVRGDVAGEYGANTRRALQTWAARL